MHQSDPGLIGPADLQPTSPTGVQCQSILYERLLYHHEPGWDSLKHNDASYRVIFENTGTGAFVKEADMTIAKVNSQFERLTGYSKSDIEGEMKWTDFFLEEDRERLIGYHADRRAEANNAPRELECRIKDSMGAIKHVYLTLDLIPGTRIIAATNRDMKERMDSQMMRRDFFYRIHILPIYLPPLRNRKADLPLLIDHFMMLYGGKKNLPPITGRLMDRLMEYDWPGNVRELQNVVIRFCHSQKIELMETLTSPFETPVTEDVTSSDSRASLRSMLDAYEKKVIVEVLNGNQWHRCNAARQLGIDRKTLFTKMKRHGLAKASRVPRREAY